MLKGSDQVLRSMTRDGAFRVITTLTMETVRGAVDAQQAAGTTAKWLGELITSSILVREAMSPDRRVQMLLKDANGGTLLVADSHPEGWNRGIVNPGARVDAAMDQASLIEVLYTLPNDILQQGVVQLPAGGEVSEGVMTYMQESEQVTSMIAVRTIVDGERRIRASGGYLVQLLPDASHESLEAMTAALSAFVDMEALLSDAATTTDRLRDGVIGEIEAQEMARGYLCFGCNCSRSRILTGLRSLTDADLEELIATGEALNINCDVCRKAYEVSVQELQSLLEA